MKDKEMKTTASQVRDAYKNAKHDETREALKMIFPDAFEDEYELVNVTDKIQWHNNCIGAREKIRVGGKKKQDVFYFQLIGIDSENSAAVLTMDQTGITNHIPWEYLLVFRDDSVDEFGNDSGFAVFRKEKI